MFFSQQLKEEKTKTTKYKKEIASLEKVIILTFRFHAHHWNLFLKLEAKNYSITGLSTSVCTFVYEWDSWKIV